ncbi:LOW QUALITY PROTEIN: V-type proton ATPase subunit F [Colletotrichum tofieldiae]|nr:LOW QUALITY PROTEIN: V-type proton ATPase subunit F [Colletotrichum tofieldiae]
MVCMGYGMDGTVEDTYLPTVPQPGGAEVERWAVVINAPQYVNRSPTFWASQAFLQPHKSPRMASQADMKDRQFLAVIGDEDSVTGLLLAGIGHVSTGADQEKNFLVVDSKTDTAAIESVFESFTTRKDIGIVLINQHLPPRERGTISGYILTGGQIADRIRHRVDTYTAAFPTVLEIPSKDHPYDPEKDSVLRRVRRLFGE